MKNYEIGPVMQRSMPFWCVANPLGDPFGPPVLMPISPLEVCNIICKAAQQGFIELTSFHDDDLVPWNPEHPDDDFDSMGKVAETLLKIKESLNGAGLEVNTATCNLHSDPIFRRGGLTNQDPKVRELAHLKVERTLRIGHFLGARHFTYWVARDGWQTAVTTPWEHVYDWIAEGLNGVERYIVDNRMENYKGGGTIEPKPNEPPGHTFLPTAGHAVGFIQTRLENASFWGVNPELRQHEGMTLLDPLTCLSYLVAMGKLPFFHFGNQINGQFDNDFPPLGGPEGLEETVMMFWLLDKLGWKGTVEFDCHMLRSEGELEHPIDCRRDFIQNCSEALALALKLALRVGDATGSSETKEQLLALAQMTCVPYPEVRELARRA